MRWDWRRAARGAVFRTDHRNILAGAVIPGQPPTAARQGFGVINSLAFGIPMRQLQLGLKYTF